MHNWGVSGSIVCSMLIHVHRDLRSRVLDHPTSVFSLVGSFVVPCSAFVSCFVQDMNEGEDEFTTDDEADDEDDEDESEWAGLPISRV